VGDFHKLIFRIKQYCYVVSRRLPLKKRLAVRHRTYGCWLPNTHDDLIGRFPCHIPKSDESRAKGPSGGGYIEGSHWFGLWLSNLPMDTMSPSRSTRATPISNPIIHSLQDARKNRHYSVRIFQSPDGTLSVFAVKLTSALYASGIKVNPIPGLERWKNPNGNPSAGFESLFRVENLTQSR
jgi:hypothetical protein